MSYNSEYQLVTPIVVNQFFVDNYKAVKNEPFFLGFSNDQIFNQIATDNRTIISLIAA